MFIATHAIAYSAQWVTRPGFKSQKDNPSQWGSCIRSAGYQVFNKCYSYVQGKIKFTSINKDFQPKTSLSSTFS